MKINDLTLIWEILPFHNFLSLAGSFTFYTSMSTWKITRTEFYSNNAILDVIRSIKPCRPNNMVGEYNSKNTMTENTMEGECHRGEFNAENPMQGVYHRWRI